MNIFVGYVAERDVEKFGLSFIPFTLLFHTDASRGQPQVTVAFDNKGDSVRHPHEDQVAGGPVRWQADPQARLHTCSYPSRTRPEPLQAKGPASVAADLAPANWHGPAGQTLAESGLAPLCRARAHGP